jgi:hypothetical protein
MGERQIHSPSPIAREDGTLARESVGWSRRPVHDCRLPAGWGRRKRWEFWCVATRDALAQITVADLDYLNLAAITVVDLASGEFVDRWRARPAGRPLGLGDRPRERDVRVTGRRLGMLIGEHADATRLSAWHRPVLGPEVEIDAEIGRDAGDSLGVLVPWSRHRFQYTCKQVALPVRGRMRVGERSWRLSPEEGAFAVLDYGRGLWPYRTRWAWACGAVRPGSGFNLGARWTDAGPVTENAILVDGVLHKVGARVEMGFEPAGCTIRSQPGGQVSLRIAATTARHVGADTWPIGARLHWLAGPAEGVVRGDEGAELRVDGALAWAEDLRARW